jgi:hypothetical protein
MVHGLQYVLALVAQYRRTSLYAIDSKIWLADNEVAYKKTKDDYKLADMLYK